MNKKLLLLVIPALMLSGCTLLDLGGESGELPPELGDYQPQHTIASEDQGEEITAEEAEATIEQIKSNLNSRNAKYATEEGRQELLNSVKYLQYDFRVKMDDYFAYMDVNYARSEQYFHSGLNAEVPEMDLSKNPYKMDSVDILDGKETVDYHIYQQDEKVIGALKEDINGHVEEDGVQKEIHKNAATYTYLDATFEQAADSMILAGLRVIDSQGLAIIERLNTIPSATYRSSGEGALFFSATMPITNMKVEGLFENDILVYAYTFIDATLLKDIEEIDYNDFDHMSTELYARYDSAKIEYPDLSKYVQG